MNMTRYFLGRFLLFLFVTAFVAGPAGAAQLGSLGSDLKKAGQDITDTAKNAGQEVATLDEGASGKLPGGVSSRLKKMNDEMNKAEQALEKGAGTGVDRAQRAEQSLKRARGYKAEIEKSYAGQYSEEHPDVAATLNRLAELEKAVQASGQSAASEEDARRKAREQEEAAAAEAAAQTEAAAKASEEEAARSRQSAEADCENWNQRMQVFTEGDKALYPCSSADDAAIPRCKGIYDEAVTLKAEFEQTPLATEPCGALHSTLSDLNRYMDNFKSAFDSYAAEQTAAQANLGQIVFSKDPIDPGNPSNLTGQFNAGDHIYGLIRTTKPWSAIYEKQSGADVMVNVKLDGAKIHAQFVKLKTPELMQRQYLVFEVAPDPGKMTAYSDPGREYGNSTATLRQGPNELTYHLGQLSPGTHTMAFNITYYGTVWAAGSFTIEGGDFQSYARLHEQIAKGVAASVTLPAARMTDNNMAARMKSLLENAGWKNVHRINIVDKEWWIDRVSGGNSAVKSRHLAAAALAEDQTGYYYKMCTFHQDKLITGAFSELYLSHQGDRVPVSKENIDK